jgi:hypothetical protein
MPDRRKHRGPHPDDGHLFGPETQPRLRAAAGDFCWLLSHGYPHDSTLKLVGDRYDLVARQRTAVSRCCCSEADAAKRQFQQVSDAHLAGATLWLDGYNVLTTIEAALAGGVILAARDGVCRDMASMHGSYRKVTETMPALELLGRTTAELGVAECRWLFDQPVSNSGRLKQVIESMGVARGWPWRAELTPDPDAVLAEPPEGVVVATADSEILNRGPAWYNLAKETVARHIPNAWVVELP